MKLSGGKKFKRKKRKKGKYVKVGGGRGKKLKNKSVKFGGDKGKNSNDDVSSKLV